MPELLETHVAMSSGRCWPTPVVAEVGPRRALDLGLLSDVECIFYLNAQVAYPSASAAPSAPRPCPCSKGCGCSAGLIRSFS